MIFVFMTAFLFLFQNPEQAFNKVIDPFQFYKCYLSFILNMDQELSKNTRATTLLVNSYFNPSICLKLSGRLFNTPFPFADSRSNVRIKKRNIKSKM